MCTSDKIMLWLADVEISPFNWSGLKNFFHGADSNIIDCGMADWENS